MRSDAADHRAAGPGSFDWAFASLGLTQQAGWIVAGMAVDDTAGRILRRRVDLSQFQRGGVEPGRVTVTDAM